MSIEQSNAEALAYWKRMYDFTSQLPLPVETEQDAKDNWSAMQSWLRATNKRPLKPEKEKYSPFQQNILAAIYEDLTRKACAARKVNFIDLGTLYEEYGVLGAENRFKTSISPLDYPSTLTDHEKDLARVLVKFHDHQEGHSTTEQEEEVAAVMRAKVHPPHFGNQTKPASTVAATSEEAKQLREWALLRERNNQRVLYLSTLFNQKGLSYQDLITAHQRIIFTVPIEVPEEPPLATGEREAYQSLKSFLQQISEPQSPEDQASNLLEVWRALSRKPEWQLSYFKRAEIALLLILKGMDHSSIHH